MTNVRKTDDKNQIFIVCLYLTMFFRADLIKATLTGKAIGSSINTLPMEKKNVEDDTFIDEVISKA